MNLPKHIADIITPAPEGFTWVYRGFGWIARNVHYAIYDPRSREITEITGSDRNGNANGVTSYEYIELVEIVKFDFTTLDGQMEYAKILVGQRVRSKNTTGVYSEKSHPTGWEVAGYKFIGLTTNEYRNRAVEESLKKGWSVVVWMTDDGSLLPVEIAEVVRPVKSTTIKLTNDYDVIIYKDKLEVGCQTISKEKLCEVMLEMEKL